MTKEDVEFDALWKVSFGYEPVPFKTVEEFKEAFFPNNAEEHSLYLTKRESNGDTTYSRVDGAWVMKGKPND